MGDLITLETKVKALYEGRNASRSEWADWLYGHHVLVVADFAESLAERFGADKELARAAALLHDIADVKMKRSDESHENESLNMARLLLKENGYNEQETALIVDDAVRFHSCRGGERPASLEGKVLATADSLAHLKTDFICTHYGFSAVLCP